MSSSFGPFVRCTVCKEFDFKDRHRCPPMFQCRFDHDDEDDWRTVHAADVEQAAARFCEQVDNEGDYNVLQNGEAMVFARATQADPWRRVHVAAETLPHYSGREDRNHG